MGDRTQVSLEIGGTLKREHIQDLLDAADCDGVCLDWDSGQRLTLPHIEAVVLAGEPLHLTGHEINGAELDELEAFCRAHSLPYRKEWDAGGSYSAGGELSDGKTVEEYCSSGIGEEPGLWCATITRLGSWEAVQATVARLTAGLPPLVLTGDAPLVEAA